MNMISKNVTVNQSVDFNRYVKDSNWKQAKITGMLCIGCSIVAGLLSVGALFLPVLKLYFPLLLLSATLGLFGFQEVSYDRNKKLNLFISIISLSLLIVLFIITFSSDSEMILIVIQFWILYGLLSTVIPIFLTISALISNNTEKWKSLMPLAIPTLFTFSSTMANSNSSKTALLLLPIGWGLLGIVTYIGNAALNSNEELSNMDFIGYE